MLEVFKRRGRNIPWLNVVRFHKEIASRAESSFFSLNGSDPNAERWSSINDFDISNLAGPWCIPKEKIVSNSFKLAAEQGGHDTTFIGGPCYLAWEKGRQNNWVPQWRPILYREVKIQYHDDYIEISPDQGNWYLSPMICNLLGRLQVSAGDDLDAFARDLVEKASKDHGDQGSISESIISTLVSILPDLKSDLSKQPRSDTFISKPSPWVLFAPTSSFSALTRYLMADYNRLESLIEVDPSNIGGLEVLDDKVAKTDGATQKILPVTPLNDAQSKAVQSILGNDPLTVVSGPPGCGKSQVVVSTLLNAWASGKSVLFASNNNNAVDVVRERIEQFEAEFPIAVRAGNRQKNNVVELLRKVLNYAGSNNITSLDLKKAELECQKLIKKQRKIQDRLNEKLPQQSSEGLRTALKAYGVYQELVERIQKEKDIYNDELDKFNLKEAPHKDIGLALEKTDIWLKRSIELKEDQEKDGRRLHQLNDDLKKLQNRRNDTVATIGLDFKNIENWSWLEKGPSYKLIDLWVDDFEVLLNGQYDQSLEPFTWESEFESWDTDIEAIQTEIKAQKNASSIKSALLDLAPRIEKINQCEEHLKVHSRELSDFGLEEVPKLQDHILSEWSNYYADYISRSTKKIDILPWSHKSIIKRKLSKIERDLRPFIPLSKWKDIGHLDNLSGRDKLSDSVELLIKWKTSYLNNELLCDERSYVETILKTIRLSSSSLGIENTSEIKTIADCELVLTKIEGLSLLATRAAKSIKKKIDLENTLQLISKIALEWNRIGSGYPLKESWAKTIGSRFTEALKKLNLTPSSTTLLEVREAYYSGSITTLRSTWMDARRDLEEIASVKGKISAVPSFQSRIREWFKESPSPCLLSVKASDLWPDFDDMTTQLSEINDLYIRYKDSQETILPKLYDQVESEQKWALDRLVDAIAILPTSKAKKTLEEYYNHIMDMGGAEWPVKKISAAFQEFSPVVLKAKIAQINSELSQRSFEQSKKSWIDRLNNDDDAIEAIDSLEKVMRRNNGKIEENDFELFRLALRLVPIWITTAQAAQAIPLEPKLFDIVIIDEASQCTLTNLLPLLYRGKRLAIIGDHEQLPAIPTIQEAEELSLAKKYGVEAFLNLIGHSNNDVYSAASDSLPRGRAGILQLNEHFRSHPQIIGFSNRHIYQQRLVMKTDLSSAPPLPIGSGMHKIHICGTSSRDDRGRSWKNIPEAQAVINLIRGFQSNSEMTHYSIGIVTPFSAQKEFLRNLIDTEMGGQKILVDSAYGFQGDERDIMIFSPVVAPGITTSATRWVESPPNLINVALTRARQALFIVADFNYCVQQNHSGILRKLADYCTDIQTLRNTSPAELELFSWMTVEGLTPEIHPRIGDIEVDFGLKTVEGLSVAIEVDGGEFHNDRKVSDSSRDSFLQAQGWSVLRIPARSILETPHKVIQDIKSVLKHEDSVCC